MSSIHFYDQESEETESREWTPEARKASSRSTISGPRRLRPTSPSTGNDVFLRLGDASLRNRLGGQSGPRYPEDYPFGYLQAPWRHGSGPQHRSVPGVVRYDNLKNHPPGQPTYDTGRGYTPWDLPGQSAEQHDRNLNSEVQKLREEVERLKRERQLARFEEEEQLVRLEEEKEKAQLEEEIRTETRQHEMEIFSDEIINQAIRQIQRASFEIEAAYHDRDRKTRGEASSRRISFDPTGDREEPDRRHLGTYQEKERLASRFDRETGQRKNIAERVKNRTGQSRRVKPRRDSGRQQEHVFIPMRKKQTEHIKSSQPNPKRVVMSGGLPVPRMVSKPNKTKGLETSDMAQDTSMNDPTNRPPQDRRRAFPAPFIGSQIPVPTNIRNRPPAPTAEDPTTEDEPTSLPPPVPQRKIIIESHKEFHKQVPSQGSVETLSEKHEAHSAGQADQHTRDQDRSVRYGDEAVRHFENIPESKYSPTPRHRPWNGIPGMVRDQAPGGSQNNTAWTRRAWGVSRDSDQYSSQSGTDEDRGRELHAHVENKGTSPAPAKADLNGQTHTGFAMNRDLDDFPSKPPQSDSPSEDRSIPSLGVSQPGPEIPASEPISLPSIGSLLQRDGPEQYRLSPESFGGQWRVPSSYVSRRFKKNMYDAMIDALCDACHILQPPALRGIHVIPTMATMATMLQVPQVVMQEERHSRKPSLSDVDDDDDDYLSLDDDSGDRKARAQRRRRRYRRHKGGPSSSQLAPEHCHSHTDDSNFSPSKEDHETRGGAQNPFARDDVTAAVDGQHRRSDSPRQPEQNLSTLLTVPALEQHVDDRSGNLLADYTRLNGGEDAHGDVLESDSEQSFKTASAGNSRRGSFEDRNGPEIRPLQVATAVEALQTDHSDVSSSRRDSDLNEGRSTFTGVPPRVATPPSAKARHHHYRQSPRVRLARPTMMMVPVTAPSYFLLPLGHGARSNLTFPHQNQWFSQPSWTPRTQAGSGIPEPASKDPWDQIRRRRHRRYKDEESEPSFESSEESEESGDTYEYTLS